VQYIQIIFGFNTQTHHSPVRPTFDFDFRDTYFQ
jgi:hypothetical protein